MKRLLSLFLLLLAIALPAALAELNDPPPAPAALPAVPSSGVDDTYQPPPAFLDVVRSNGTINFLIWLGIGFWTLAVVPLGILSIMRSCRSETGGLPAATWWLIIGAIGVLLLGLLGFSRGMTATFFTCAINPVNKAWAEINLSASHALYSLAFALLVCHIHFLFLLPTLIIRHVKCKRLERTEVEGQHP